MTQRKIPEKWWKAFGHLLLDTGYLNEILVTNTFGATIELSDQGSEWLKSVANDESPKLLLTPSMELFSADDKKRSESVTLSYKSRFE